MQTTTNTNTRPGAALAGRYTIDGSHSTVGFSVRHMMVTNVRGEFQKLAGRVVWDPQRPEATEIEVTIDVASINTREAARDTHLKSADFFDAEKHPSLTFKSRGASRRKEGRIEVVGDLTIRGTSRVVVLDVEGPTEAFTDPWGNLRIGASARTTIKRSEFGMTWNTLLEAGGVLVGDDITITLDVSLIKEKS